MTFDREAERLREVYRMRDERGLGHRYGARRPSVVLDRTGLELAWIRALRGERPWDRGPVLDLGCGGGSWLRRLLDWGLEPARAVGIDLVPERVEAARRLAPAGMQIHLGNGLDLPFADGRFALIWAHTVFSSVPDPDLRTRLASEVQRVLAPGGIVILYDFRYPSPANTDVVPIRRGEVRRLFPGTDIRRRTMTLLPPLSRRLAAVATWACVALERCCPPLRSHALYRIDPSRSA